MSLKEGFYMEYLIEIAAIMTASACVMILHELPKSLMYILTGRHCQKEDRRKIFNVFRYIDPIGMILFLVCHAGASRPYPYRLREKDTNIAIGTVGFLSLLVMIVAGTALYSFLLMRFPMLYNVDATEPLMFYVIKLSWYFIYASIVLLIVNLFPTVTSDLFLLVVAFVPSRLTWFFKYDSMIKVVLLLCFIFEYVQSWAMMGMNLIYQFLGFV